MHLTLTVGSWVLVDLVLCEPIEDEDEVVDVVSCEIGFAPPGGRE